MTKTVLAMTSLRPNSEAALQAYMDIVGPLMEKAGAKLIMRYEVSSALAGSDHPQFVSVIEYPDAEAVESVFNSPDYISLKSVKDTAFSKYHVCLANE